MKKNILLVVMILTLTIIIVGCLAVKEPINTPTSANNEPPDISVFINNREINTFVQRINGTVLLLTERILWLPY